MSNAHLERAISRLHNGTTNEVARAQAEAKENEWVIKMEGK